MIMIGSNDEQETIVGKVIVVPLHESLKVLYLMIMSAFYFYLDLTINFFTRDKSNI